MMTIAIQAGGESRRMGQEKAFLPFLGEPLIQRIIKRISGLGGDIMIITNRPVDFTFLDLPLQEDLWPGTGVLGGLATALTVARQPLVANIACDMPFVNAELLAEGYRMLTLDTHLDAFIPLSEKGYEPLHAVYRRETCLAAVTQALATGKRRMISWFDQAQIYSFPPSEVIGYDPQGLAFWNLNTPEEFKSAENLARRQENDQ